MRSHRIVVLQAVCMALILALGVPLAQAQEAAVGAPITAADINALRSQTEAQNPNGCSSVFRWTDDPIVPGQTPVKAHHLIELRRAINEMVRGVCPTIHEQVMLEGVRLSNGTAGYHNVEGAIINTGSTRISGRRLNVRVRFFDSNNQSIAEEFNYLRVNVDASGAQTTLDPQQRHLFWVQVQDRNIQDWAYFQVVAFETGDRSILCSGCARRHARQREHVTVEGVHFDDETNGYRHVRGSVRNSGTTRLVGRRLTLRVRFFDDDIGPIVEESNYLRINVNASAAQMTLDPQQRHLFWVQVQDSDIQDWDYFQVAAFEDDERSIPCSGCDLRHVRELERVTFEGVRVGTHPHDDRYRVVWGTVMNSGMTRIVGRRLTVRVRYFRGNSLSAEENNYLRVNVDGSSAVNTLDVEGEHLFWVDHLSGYDSFQLSFDNDEVTMDCSNCDQRYTP